MKKENDMILNVKDMRYPKFFFLIFLSPIIKKYYILDQPKKYFFLDMPHLSVGTFHNTVYVEFYDHSLIILFQL